VAVAQATQDLRALARRAVEARELALEPQVEQEFGVAAIRLQSGAGAAANLGRVTDSDLMPQLLEHGLEPLAVAAGLDADDHFTAELSVIAEHVRIRQKTIKHSPLEKLTDAFIAILAGAHGLCEVNTRVRADAAVQRSFGHSSCAEQSMVQETLDRCSAENVRQMEGAVEAIFRAHSQAYRHDYQAGLLLLDVDLTGMPYGKQAEEATKGYFSQPRVRYGRQMGRVVAPRYDEVVADRLNPGNLQLRDTLPHLVEALEQTLELDEGKRRRTVLRIDARGGSMNGLNWLLRRGYHVHCKDISSKRVVRDVLQVSGFVELGKSGAIKRGGLNGASALGRACAKALRVLLEDEHVRVILGET
jgi:hypothetical protein